MCSDLLSIRPLTYILTDKPKTYNKYQIPVVKPCLHFTSLKQYNIILSLNSIPIAWNTALQITIIPLPVTMKKEIKKTTSQIQFLAVTVKEQIKPVIKQISTRQSDWQFCREIVVKLYLIFT